MHATALQLVPILGAEKSKVAFYIVAGVLVAWALTVSLGLGLRREDFPGQPAGQRLVIAVSAVLVLATVTTAVLTSGGSTAKPSAAAGEAPSATAAPTPSTSSPPAPPKAGIGRPAAPPAPAAAGSNLKLAANPSGLLRYNTKQLSAKAGRVSITMTNMSPLEHNVTIAKGSTVLGATPTFQGGSRTLTLNLKPGTYTFYCSVPGHRQAGMEGTLTVS
jgi:plastocyanin